MLDSTIKKTKSESRCDVTKRGKMGNAFHARAVVKWVIEIFRKALTCDVEEELALIDRSSSVIKRFQIDLIKVKNEM